MLREEYPPKEVGGGVKMPKNFTSGSHLDAREVEAMAVALKPLRGPLDAREVVVVADMLKREKGPPPARISMRGRVEAVEAALKPLRSPPPARVWTRGRWKRGSGVVGVSSVIILSHCRFILVVRLVTSVAMGE